jgi:hypothetical protein
MSQTEIAKVESFCFLPPTFGRGRVLFLPALPCLPATDAAALEEAAIAVFGRHVVPGKRMAELAEFELCDGEQPLYPVMRRVAASFPNASWHLAGQNALIGRNNPDERVPEQMRGRGLAVE